MEGGCRHHFHSHPGIERQGGAWLPRRLGNGASSWPAIRTAGPLSLSLGWERVAGCEGRLGVCPQVGTLGRLPLLSRL